MLYPEIDFEKGFPTKMAFWTWCVNFCAASAMDHGKKDERAGWVIDFHRRLHAGQYLTLGAVERFVPFYTETASVDYTDTLGVWKELAQFEDMQEYETVEAVPRKLTPEFLEDYIKPGDHPGELLLMARYSKNNIPVSVFTLQYCMYTNDVGEKTPGIETNGWVYTLSRDLFSSFKEIIRRHTRTYVSENKTVYRTLLNKQDDSIVLTQELLDSSSKLAGARFYPYHKIGDTTHTPKDIMEDFLRSKNNCIFLLGQPGTGKTTFIRTAAVRTNAAFIFQSNRSFMSRPDFVNEIALLAKSLLGDKNTLKVAHGGRQTRMTESPRMNLPQNPPWNPGSLTTAVVDRSENKYDHVVIVVEEAQLLVCDGSDLRVHEALADVIDGSLSDERVKWVFSMNDTDPSHINARLARVGRAHDILGFRSLCHHEAIDVRQDLGLPFDDLQPNKRYTLAEVLSGENLTTQSAVQGRVRSRFDVKMN